MSDVIIGISLPTMLIYPEIVDQASVYVHQPHIDVI